MGEPHEATSSCTEAVARELMLTCMTSVGRRSSRSTAVSAPSAGHIAISYRDSQTSAGVPVVPVVRVASWGGASAQRKVGLLPDEVGLDRDRDAGEPGVEAGRIDPGGREPAAVEGRLPGQPPGGAANPAVAKLRRVRVGQRAVGERLDVVARLAELAQRGIGVGDERWIRRRLDAAGR